MLNLQTDHSRNLQYLNTNTPKVVRWKLAIQEFDFVLEHIKGLENVVADTLSRLCLSEGDEIAEIEYGSNVLSAIRMETDESIPSPCRCLQESSVTECGTCIATVAALHDVVIPDDKYELIEMFHNKQVGHFGVELTLKKLRNQGLEWTNIRKFVRQCTLCQKLSAVVLAIKTKPFTTASLEPQEKLNID